MIVPAFVNVCANVPDVCVGDWNSSAPTPMTLCEPPTQLNVTVSPALTVTSDGLNTSEAPPTPTVAGAACGVGQKFASAPPSRMATRTTGRGVDGGRTVGLGTLGHRQPKLEVPGDPFFLDPRSHLPDNAPRAADDPRATASPGRRVPCVARPPALAA